MKFNEQDLEDTFVALLGYLSFLLLFILPLYLFINYSYLVLEWLL